MKGGSSHSANSNSRNGDKQQQQQSHQRQQHLHSQVHDSLFSYLESTCSREALLRLYEDEGRGKYAAKTLLQRLPELGRQFVLRLVASSSSSEQEKPSQFELEKLQLWCQNSNDVLHSLEQMEALCIIEPLLRNEEDDKIILNSKKQVVRLTRQYAKAIQQALTSWESAPWPEVTLEMYQELAQKASSTLPPEKQHITSSNHHASASPPPTLEQLEAYTQIRWDSVLHFLVGDTVENDNGGKHHSSKRNNNNSNYYERPPPAVIHFLEITNLMQRDPDHKSTKTEAPLVISSKGYEFMLQDVHVQVWQFILQYFFSLESHRKFEELRHEAVLFLLCLSYCRVGSAYAASSLSNKHARTLMKDLKRFGLLYVTKVGGVTLFYPTRVAVNLVVGSLHHMDTGGGKRKQSQNDPYFLTDDAMFVRSTAQIRSLEVALAIPEPTKSPHIAILVQTNFHLCAYTTSELHVKMLSLFCDLREYRRLPNCIMTKLTRDSVKAAFSLGITAAQILRFLKMNAHPQVAIPANNYSLIPQNVEDQIWLWDRERTRVRFQEVYILQCTSRAEYLSTQQYAIDHDAYAWSRSPDMGTAGAKASNNKIMLKYEKADMVMSYLRRWRASRAAAANGTNK